MSSNIRTLKKRKAEGIEGGSKMDCEDNLIKSSANSAETGAAARNNRLEDYLYVRLDFK